MAEPVTVTVHDPATGETVEQELPLHGYVLLVGEHMEVTSLQRHLRTGTIQITIKRKASE